MENENKLTTLYFLYELIEVVLGTKDGKEITRTDRVPVGAFTDNGKRLAFRDSFEISKGHKGFEENEEITDKEVGEIFNSTKVDPIIEIKDNATDQATSQEE